MSVILIGDLLSRYANYPSVTHWIVFERVFHYLKSTLSYALRFVRYPAIIEEYSDANWISDSLNIKSTFGYILIVGGTAISWQSTK